MCRHLTIIPLNKLTFNKCLLGGEMYQYSAPVCYGGVIRRAMAENAPKEAYDKGHLRESRLGARGNFHGPRLSVYSTDYSGVPDSQRNSMAWWELCPSQTETQRLLWERVCRPLVTLNSVWLKGNLQEIHQWQVHMNVKGLMLIDRETL